MARTRSTKNLPPSPPSLRAAILFTSALVPAVSLGLVLLALVLFSLAVNEPEIEEAIVLAIALGLLLPLPFALRGKRTAMVFPLASLLIFFAGMVIVDPFNLGEGLSMVGFALGGGYCVALSHAFKRSRTWLEEAPLANYRFALPLLALALLGLRLGQGLALIPQFNRFVGLDLVLIVLLVVAALPGSVHRVIRGVAALFGLIMAGSCLLILLALRGPYELVPISGTAVLRDPTLISTLLCLGLAAVLWFDRPR